MPASDFCAYNETRENLLMTCVTVIDTRTDPLKTVKVLIEGPAPDTGAGLWLNPLKSIPAVPRLSAYDLVYLDREGCVVRGMELAPDDDVPRVDTSAASALLLPLHTFTASHIEPGDRVVIRPAGETTPPAAPVAASPVSKPSAVAPPASSDPASASRFWSTHSPICELPILSSGPLTNPVTSPLASPVASLATEPIAPPDAIQSPAPVRPSFQFLRTLARLRIHIQISITTAPAAAPAAAPVAAQNLAAPPTQPRFSVGSRFSAPARLRSLTALSAAALRSFVTRAPARLRRQGRSAGAAYLRWAEAFVFGPGHTASFGDLLVPRVGRYIVGFIFPR